MVVLCLGDFMGVNLHLGRARRKSLNRLDRKCYFLLRVHAAGNTLRPVTYLLFMHRPNRLLRVLYTALCLFGFALAGLIIFR